MTLLHRRAALGLAGTVVIGLFTPAPARTNAAAPASPTTGLRVRYYDILDDRAGGNLHVLGEYTNTGPEAIVAPALGLELLDRTGASLETDNLFPASGRLAPGETGGFSGAIHLARGAWTHERLIVCTTDLLGPPDTTAALDLRDLTEVEKTSRQLHVTGTIANNGPVTISGLRVRAIITRARDGRFAGVGSTTLDGPLPAKTTAAFSLTVAAADMPGIRPGDDYAYRLEPGLARSLGITCG